MSNHEKSAAVKELQKRFNAIATKPAIFDQQVMAARVSKAQLLLHDACRARGPRANRQAEEKLWKDAAALLQRALYEAYPDRFWESLSQLKNGDPSVLEMYIEFLETDPWFFRSGYVKADLLRYICRIPLTEAQVERMRKVIIAAIQFGDRREFRAYRNAAVRLKSNEFRSQIEELLASSDPGIRRRARWVLAAF